MSGWFATLANSIAGTGNTSYNIGDANGQSSTLGNLSAYSAEGIGSLFGMDSNTSALYGSSVGAQIATATTGLFGSGSGTGTTSTIAGANSTTANTGNSTLDSILNWGSSLLGGSSSPTAQGENAGTATADVLSKVSIGRVATIIVGILLILGGLWMFSSSDTSSSLSSIADSISKITASKGGKAAEVAEAAA